jgi:ABC transporter substrate binding protein
MAQDSDPVGNGFVASLARPGGNITGLSTLSPETSGKQLELLREILPKLSRVGVLGDVTRPGIPQALREINLAADAFRVQVQYLEVRGPKDIETAFRAASQERADAVLVLGSPVLLSQRRQVIDLAVKEPAPGDIRQARICGRRGAYDLRREHHRLVPPRRYLCGQDPERREARRSARRAAEEVRNGYQSESGKANRPGDSTECAGESG